MEKPPIIVSLGGSIICPQPEKIAVSFLRKFKNFILNLTKRGKRFIILTGGGKICRLYQKSASKIAKVSKKNLDELGISITKANAYLLKSILGREAKILVWEKYRKISKEKWKILIAPGWKPGHSTDYDAVFLAQKLKIKEIINLSDIDYVYTKNPKIYKKAKPIEKISWSGFQKIVGEKWQPGLSMPFDPKATKLAQRLKMKVFFLKGTDVPNLKNFFEGKKFKGTLVY